METANQTKKTPTAVPIHSTPSLLRQIMDVVDEMDEGEKRLLLIKLKKEELMQQYKELDDAIAQSEWIMSEEDIDKMVTETRREMYEERIRS